MKYFVARLKHDDGEVFIKTTASRPEQAAKQVENAEGCPPGTARIKQVPKALFSMPGSSLWTLDYNFFIDKQFGAPVPIMIEDGRITEVDDPEYNGKLAPQLIGKTLEEARQFLKETFPGIYMNLKRR